MRTRPNVILFITDQLRADHLGCYGNRVVRTTAIDSIAARGLRFSRFYAASPLCMPNRATLMTGRVPSLHGVRRNGIPLACNERTFVEQLRASGYATALVGKAHFQPYGMFRRPEHEPRVEARLPPGWPDAYRVEEISRWEAMTSRTVPSPYYGFEHTELCIYHGDEVKGDYAVWLEEKCPGAYMALCGEANALSDDRYHCRDAWRTRLPEDLHSSAFVAERSSAWLERYASMGEERPFFLMCSFPDPHHPFTPPGRYWDMYDPEGVVLPAAFNQRNEHPALEYVRRVSADARRLPPHHPFAANEREAREAIALTYGMISNIDSAIDVVLKAIDKAGLSENTIVAFTSDHGDLMGDYGIFLKGPMHFSGLTRVPFLWLDPRKLAGSGTNEKVCGTIDVARTVLDVTGCSVYNGLQGQNLVDVETRGLDDERGVLIESESAQLLFGQSAPYRLRSLVLSDWRLTYSSNPSMCEMYDLKKDPFETDNLWSDEAYESVRERLLERLLASMLAHAEESPTPLASG